ncbi:hypothetical protein [Alcaligenes endophyticus]|uniref:Uncharacterized protein n=1 Tax=Alcaligenes endophyticus TaxID=1929088 RepID=A0ABT8EIV6_9BURK|nr:hypothetical protein [Alcaligenes endophyticus]MCX5592498.1 hypothetical protein [Alcaligenes endophyticus]MDN4121223.1 hypothetical protein [Alcaligenes endophyticus]
MSKPQVNRASVSDLRQSIDTAQHLTKAGVAFICVPYFNEVQKQVAAGIAHKNISSVELDTGTV